MADVAVLGAGNMGTAVAQAISGNGHDVRLWSIETDVLEEIRDRGLNSKYLPGVRLHERISAFFSLEDAIAGARLVILSVPSHIVRTLAYDIAPHVTGEQLVLNVGKGLEESSRKRLSEVIAEEAPKAGGVLAMGGPAIAMEVAQGAPTAVIVGAKEAVQAAEAQAIMQNDYLKVEATADIAGVELGACLKNVYAIALGMCDGMGYGANAKAFVASIALNELALISRELGGEARTAYGLAGLGDLLTTGYSAHSRNRTLGERLGSDSDWQAFMQENTVEGVVACRIMREVAHGMDEPTPLLYAIYDVLFAGEKPAETLRLFLRDFRYG